MVAAFGGTDIEEGASQGPIGGSLLRQRFRAGDDNNKIKTAPAFCIFESAILEWAAPY
jgi:hypothetical protein